MWLCSLVCRLTRTASPGWAPGGSDHSSLPASWSSWRCQCWAFPGAFQVLVLSISFQLVCYQAIACCLFFADRWFISWVACYRLCIILQVGAKSRNSESLKFMEEKSTAARPALSVCVVCESFPEQCAIYCSTRLLCSSALAGLPTV